MAWNCRGLARPKAIRNLRANIRKYNPDVIFLSEILVSDERTISIVNSLGFHLFVHYPAECKKGRLLLLWRPGVEIEPVNININAISVLVYSDPTHQPWIITYVYAPAQWNNKAGFWSHLDSLYQAFPGPWICLGDFNDLIDQNKKSGGRPIYYNPNKGLKALMDRNGLIDIGYMGPKFIWTNNRQGQALIRERLDRAIANQEWRLLFLDATLQHLASSASDHHPILLYTTANTRQAPSFKFEEFWTREPLSHQKISEAWSKHHFSNPSYILCKKIKSTKEALKVWNKDHFRRINHNIHQLESELLEVQEADMTPSNQEKERFLQHRIHKQREYEEILWKQKSRLTWLTSTDLNTKFYHLITTIRRRRNTIDSIKLAPVSDIENESLNAIPVEEEILEALKQIPSNKAPGPDGMTTLFYKHYWSIVKQDVILAVQNFFISGKLLKQINHTNIALIPKTKCPNNPSQYRPISLTNKTNFVSREFRVVGEHLDIFRYSLTLCPPHVAPSLRHRVTNILLWAHHFPTVLVLHWYCSCREPLYVVLQG
ncbi:hypothetical protein F2P56_037171 [Juglans regia]|uniref:Endonuclease/exonuclease/phosphatase domain-containing protein n=2 Tax=Juglans regia TaxID=51240 RepID=A0A833TV54_JUGRE|nr:uncharacterized protein LOC109021946 [Juglans regia]KAF5442124.1 hypothetical protein F2P56_037171 [Juglans regia]